MNVSEHLRRRGQRVKMWVVSSRSVWSLRKITHSFGVVILGSSRWWIRVQGRPVAPLYSPTKYSKIFKCPLSGGVPCPRLTDDLRPFANYADFIIAESFPNERVMHWKILQSDSDSQDRPAPRDVSFQNVRLIVLNFQTNQMPILPIVLSTRTIYHFFIHFIVPIQVQPN